jgi:hypothetical protein
MSPKENAAKDGRETSNLGALAGNERMLAQVEGWILGVG